MKFKSLPVKRRPVQQGMLKRIRAVTGSRRQRVSASAANHADFESDDSSSKISRALTIIFLIHIVAIGLLFVHWKFLDGRSTGEDASAATTNPAVDQSAASPKRQDLPLIAAGEKSHIVRPGDNYARIAASLGVEESELRLLNKHVPIEPGRLLKIPPRRIVAMEPSEVTAIRNQNAAANVEHNDGLVAAVDVRDAPRATLVRPADSANKDTPRATTVERSAMASGKTHVMAKGETIWGIANRYKVSQEALIKLNNIKDPTRVKIGQTLSIPR